MKEPIRLKAGRLEAHAVNIKIPCCFARMLRGVSWAKDIPFTITSNDHVNHHHHYYRPRCKMEIVLFLSCLTSFKFALYLLCVHVKAIQIHLAMIHLLQTLPALAVALIAHLVS